MYGKSFGISGRAVACFFALGCVQLAQAASVVAPSGWDRFWSLTNGANSQRVGFGSDGTPIATTQHNGGSKLGAMGVYADPVVGSKGLEVRGSASVPLGNTGRSAAVAVVGKVSAASLAFSAAKLLSGPWGIVAAVAIPYVYEWATRAGVSVNAQGAGSISAWTYTGDGNCGVGAGVAMMRCSLVLQHGTNELSACYGSDNGSSFVGGCTYTPNGNFLAGGAVRAAMVVQPATLSEIEAALASAAPQPQALGEMVSKGSSVEVGAPVISGPGTVNGPVSTTTTAAQNGNPATSTTTTTTYNTTYAGDTVNYNSSTNVAVNNGTTITNTTTAEDVPPPDDPCVKNPGRIGCSEFGTPEPQSLPSSTLSVAMTPVAFSEVTGCPPNLSASFSVMGTSYTPSFSYAKLCTSITDYVKPVLLILAFAASAFIFIGGLKS